MVAVLEAWCKDRLAPLALRLALGFVCAYHGYLKIMAAGGTSWSPGLATGWQLFLSWGEFVAGLAILVGFHCRWFAALALGLTAGSLIWWQGRNILRLSFRTLEPTVLIMVVGLAILLLGAGEISLDGRSGKGSSVRAAKKK